MPHSECTAITSPTFTLNKPSERLSSPILRCVAAIGAQPLSDADLSTIRVLVERMAIFASYQGCIPGGLAAVEASERAQKAAWDELLNEYSCSSHQLSARQAGRSRVQQSTPPHHAHERQFRDRVSIASNAPSTTVHDENHAARECTSNRSLGVNRCSILDSEQAGFDVAPSVLCRLSSDRARGWQHAHDTESYEGQYMYGSQGREHQQLEDAPPAPSRPIASVPFLDTKCSQSCEPAASHFPKVSLDDPGCRTEEGIHQHRCGVHILTASDGDSGMSTVLLHDRISSVCRDDARA